MDLQFTHPTNIYALRACHYIDADDLIAIAGTNSLQVLLLTVSDIKPIASFHLGTRVTAIAWSSASVSPTKSDHWEIQLACATSDYNLHLLTASADADPHIFPFGGGAGGGLSGHHGLINDMSFCGGSFGGQAGSLADGARYVATVSDDKCLMVWDLEPSGLALTSRPSPSQEDKENTPIQGTDHAPRVPTPKELPTAYVLPFPHPLVSIRSHPDTEREFLVSDCRGNVYLTDWRAEGVDEGEMDEVEDELLMQTDNFLPSTSAFGGFPADTIRSAQMSRKAQRSARLRHSNVLELGDPVTLAGSVMGGALGGTTSSGSSSKGTNARWGGFVDWRADMIDVVGGCFGNRWSVWAFGEGLRGGKPVASSGGVVEGAGRFKWSRTHPELFAISLQHVPPSEDSEPGASPRGAVIEIHNTQYPASQPTPLVIRKGPSWVRDFEWLQGEAGLVNDIPRMAAIVGRSLWVFRIGEGGDESPAS